MFYCLLLAGRVIHFRAKEISVSIWEYDIKYVDDLDMYSSLAVSASTI